MAYEDLIEAKQKREAQDKAKEAKAKRKGKGNGAQTGKTTSKADAANDNVPEGDAQEGVTQEEDIQERDTPETGKARGQKRKTPPDLDAPESEAKLARMMGTPEAIAIGAPVQS